MKDPYSGPAFVYPIPVALLQMAMEFPTYTYPFKYGFKFMNI